MSSSSSYSLDFAYAYGGPVATGRIRVTAEDFQVDEMLGFEPGGEGEHVFIKIRKRNTNTEWLARQLASFAGIENKDVSYSGLKDRNAVTTQWFSVWLPGKAEPDWQAFNSDEWQVLEAIRHNKKLRRGVHKANHFKIVIRDLETNQSRLEEKLDIIRQSGVPNYFGEQRFGNNADNLGMAELMLVQGKRIKNRNKRSLYLSAARSYLFNKVCSARVAAGNWNTPLNGDAFMLAGSHSFFVADIVDDEIDRRFAEGDIVTTGPLWGRGRTPVTGTVNELESTVLTEFSDWQAGLENVGMKQERRALRLDVNNLSWVIHDDRLELEFELVTGSFATSVLREIVSYSD